VLQLDLSFPRDADLAQTPPPRRPHQEETKVNDQHSRHARARYSLMGALATLAAIGAIAGTAALAANSPAKPHRHATHQHAAAANGSPTKTPTSPASAPDKTGAPQPAVNHQPFLNAIAQLVNNGTITAAQGQTVDSEIQAGRVDTDTFASSGLTQNQIQAVQQALSSAKRALGPPAAPAAGKNLTPQQAAKARHS
jgi:hypothetical protein